MVFYHSGSDHQFLEELTPPLSGPDTILGPVGCPPEEKTAHRQLRHPSQKQATFGLTILSAITKLL
jgi:hypothetical protein